MKDAPEIRIVFPEGNDARHDACLTMLEETVAQMRKDYEAGHKLITVLIMALVTQPGSEAIIRPATMISGNISYIPATMEACVPEITERYEEGMILLYGDKL